jgi:hypothetical protein
MLLFNTVSPPSLSLGTPNYFTTYDIKEEIKRYALILLVKITDLLPFVMLYVQ